MILFRFLYLPQIITLTKTVNNCIKLYTEHVEVNILLHVSNNRVFCIWHMRAVFGIGLLLFSLSFFFRLLALKMPITTAADDIYKYFLIVFQRK